MTYQRACFAVLALMGNTFAVAATESASASSATSVNWAQLRDDPSRSLALKWLGTTEYATTEPGGWVERMIERRRVHSGISRPKRLRATQAPLDGLGAGARRYL
jgi:hypothetical protein